MGNGRIFLTGAYGNVGANTITHLSQQGYETIGFDVRSSENEAVARRLARKHPALKIVWGNLRDRDSVINAVTEHEPDAILHVASVIAPVAYVIPEVAEDVNVNGSRYLIEAAQLLKKPPKFINVSSYTVHGPRNPHKNYPLMTADLPFAPNENYTEHKVIVEKLVAESGLEWTTLRLPAVMPTSMSFGRHPAFIQFAFLLDLDRRMHFVDSRDAALALVNAISADTAGQSYLIAGPDDCRFIYRDFLKRNLSVRGLAPFPDDAYRVGNPEKDDCWFNEDFVDTTRSQAALKYQEHNADAYFDYLRHQYRWIRPSLKLFGGLVSRQILTSSLTVGTTNQLDDRPLWDIIEDRFGTDPKFKPAQGEYQIQ